MFGWIMWGLMYKAFKKYDFYGITKISTWVPAAAMFLFACVESLFYLVAGYIILIKGYDPMTIMYLYPIALGIAFTIFIISILVYCLPIWKKKIIIDFTLNYRQAKKDNDSNIINPIFNNSDIKIE